MYLSINGHGRSEPFLLFFCAGCFLRNPIPHELKFIHGRAQNLRIENAVKSG